MLAWEQDDFARKCDCLSHSQPINGSYSLCYDIRSFNSTEIHARGRCYIKLHRKNFSDKKSATVIQENLLHSRKCAQRRSCTDDDYVSWGNTVEWPSKQGVKVSYKKGIE